MQRNNSSFYAAVAILLAISSFVYSWKFIVPQYQKNQSEIAKTDKEIEYAKSKLDSLQTTKSSLDQLDDVVNKMFLAVPEDKDAANLITELEATASKYESVIPSIQIGDGTSVANAASSVQPLNSSAVSVSFTVNGSYDKVSQFFDALEKDIRFTNVKTFTLSTSEDNKTTSLAVQMNVFRRVGSSSLSSLVGDNNSQTEVK